MGMSKKDGPSVVSFAAINNSLPYSVSQGQLCINIYFFLLLILFALRFSFIIVGNSPLIVLIIKSLFSV